MRIGVFGGSFDPVHWGHLLLAEIAREQGQLDQVLFIPAHVPPHKQQQTLAPAKHRVEMLNLAIAGQPQFALSTIEIDRGGTSYTVETLEELRAAEGEHQWFFLMGADSLDDFPTWRQPERICELATPLILHRRGAAPVDVQRLADFVSAERLQAIAAEQIDVPTLEISSTEIRERLANGRSIRFQVPRAVEAYIETQKLYRGETAAASSGS